MSLDASGSLGGALVFSKWKGRPYVRTLVKPSNPKSALQVSMRAMFKFLSQQWAGISTANQATWQDKADAGVYSTFNAYVSENQERWRNFLAPGQADPVGEAGTNAVVNAVTATAGVRQITINVDITTQNDGWGWCLYRSLTTGFTPGVSNLIAVGITAGDGASTDYVDTPLDPDTYYYVVQCFNNDGLFQLPEAEVNATVT